MTIVPPVAVRRGRVGASVAAALAPLILNPCIGSTQQPAGAPNAREVRGRLTSPECTLSAEAADPGNPNTVWVGLITDETNRPLRRLAADLARREIATAGQGLPPTTPMGQRRPFAFVACNSTM